MIYIKRFNFLKAIKKLLGVISIPVIFCIIVDVLHIKTIVGDEWLKILGIDKNNGLYYLVNNFIDFGDFQGTFHWILLLGCIVVIVLQAIVFVSNNMQERLLIIEHNSLNQIGFKYDNDINNKYNVKKIRINQYDTFHANMPVEAMVAKAITEVDLKVKEIRKYISKGYSVGYAGIANIPTTFMLGYELGDENTKKYFHKYHGKKNRSDLMDDKFHLLEEKVIRGTFPREVLQESKNMNQPANIVLIISLTQPIKETDYSAIIGENDYVYMYKSSDDIDYDVVDSETQIEEYTKQILTDIAEIQKRENINQIRICIAASSVFVFGLGTKFSKTQNKTTLIYHFERNGYPWAINVTAKRLECSGD